MHSSKTMMKKRFLCTQTTTHINNTVKTSSLSSKWRIKQVTKSNFNEVLEEVKTHIDNSDFIAISLQKTGSYSSPWQKVLPFDTPDTAYFKAKRSAEQFQVLQFAICPFTLKGSHLTAFPFNFHLFPRDELKTGMPSYSFACQTSYLTSMARLGFDFNACIYDGISYLSRAQEAAMKPLTGNPVLRAHAVQSSRTLSVADSIFMERIKSRVRTWRSACKDSKGVHADPLVNALRKVVLGDHQSRPSMDVDVCSERQVQLVLEVLKEFSDDIVPLLIPTKHGSTQGVRVVLTRSKEDKNLFEKELQDQEEEQSKRVRGFREVIDLISASQKPIVAHNSLDELTFIHSKFLSPLPPSFEEFKGSLGSFFPYVIDLGHLLKEINPKGTTNNIPAASSYLRNWFFTPVTVDIPLTGTENEMNEGKVHGHNVLRLSHLFAKLYSVFKHNQQHGSDGNSLALEKYANIFNSCSSSTLVNSDDDDNVSSGSMRKLSCDNLIFLWGFRSGLSAIELRRLLSGSHEAFSEGFDVRLVDKSCAVVAIQQPGLTEAFLDSMSSGGTGHDNLRKLISEGLKAANYVTYKRIFDISKWDYDLADCLDQVVMSNDQLPFDSHGSRSSYEIWWDDNTVLNLDEKAYQKLVFSVREATKTEKLEMAESACNDQDSGASLCHTFDVVVIGAGIIGLSIARQFLLHSDLSVAVVDASVPLHSGATGAGQGYIWMTHRTPGTAVWDLAVRSRQLWQELINNLQAEGIDPLDTLGWKKSGSLLVGRTKEESYQLKERVQRLQAAGLRAEYLSSNDLLTKEPEIEVGPESCAAFLPDDGQIDVHNTVSFLEKGNKVFTSKRRYMDFYNDPAIRLLRSSIDGKVEAIQTNNSILYAKRAIVVAAGCWTGSLMCKFTSELDSMVNIPVQPRKGFLLTLENFKSFKLNHGVMEAGYINYQKTSAETSVPISGEAHLDQSLSISMTATLDASGNLLVGSSRQFVEFNTDVDMHIVDQIWERSREFFPSLREFSVQNLTQESKLKVGLRPYMPDGRPVIGPTPSMPNVFVATGHEGAGLILALGTAEMIADMVLGNPFKVDPTHFAVDGRCC